MSLHIFPTKDPAEIVFVAFDFSGEIEEGERLTGTPVVTVSLLSGADANPSALLGGSAAIAGASVLQTISGGVDGAIYKLRCRAALDSGRVLVLASTLPVRAA